MLTFDWDPTKAAANLRKHGVTFAEAISVFNDPVALFVPQPTAYEDRAAVIGVSSDSRLLFVVHIEFVEAETIRIISARKANQRERKRYEGHPKDR